MKIPYLILTALLLLNFKVSAQSNISGKVVDGLSNESLPFVNIFFNSDRTKGTRADINGQFIVEQSGVDSLFFSYVGYEHKAIKVVPNATGQLIISLNRKNVALKKVRITPKANPALRIMKQAIANRASNNPFALETFICNTYTKQVFDIEITEDLDSKNGQSEQSLDSFLQGGHLLLLESVTERKYKRPRLNEEKILATRVSGFKNPLFAGLATDLQPFAFYKETIKILDNNFLNPLSSGSLRKYNFELNDRIINGSDTTFIISFSPKQTKNIDALKGVLYISSKKYALENVLVEPAEKGLVHIKIEQQYNYQDTVWFPAQLNFELVMSGYPSKEFTLTSKGTSYINNVIINQPLDNKAFGIDAVVMTPMAAKKDSSFWKEYRENDLTSKESTTYRLIDSLGEEMKLETISNAIADLGNGHIRLGKIDLVAKRLLTFTEYEGTRVGLGFQTNERFVKGVSFGAYGAYGFKDKKIKYGGNVTFHLSKRNEMDWSFLYRKDLEEVGTSQLNLFNPYRYNFRNWVASRMNSHETFSTQLEFRTMRYLQANLSIAHSRQNPLYAYSYNNEVLSKDNFVNTQVGVSLRYAYREKLITSFGNRVGLGSDFPVLYVAWNKGLPNVLDSRFEYDKIECAIEQQLFIKNIGTFSYRVEAGMVKGNVPYSFLFVQDGVRSEQNYFLFRNFFQTVYPYEFLSDRQASIFLTHDFGGLLFKSNKFKPGFVLHQNMSWGTLSNGMVHHIDYKTKEKGLFETGLVINNLVRFKLFNIAYVGVGVGCFYRYGPYAFDKKLDNAKGVLSFTYSTR